MLYEICDAVRGSLQIFRKNVLKEINYYDENTFLYYEENIIAKRLQSKGYLVAVNPNCFYIHNHQSKGRIKTGQFRMLLNSMNYYLETYCNENKIKLMFLRFMEKIGITEHLLIDCLLK
ncbi:hypothetical protein BTJ18_03910 [Lactobacillus delbrueckii subsp. bulgaricus]|nr:hypothetical protein [Lactobacillus delbrueckii subsp. bulgaricus]